LECKSIIFREIT